MREHRVTTPDGRTLAVRDHGPQDGRPVLAHNGTPNSREMYPPDVERAAAAGIRLISYDRPGYGESDRDEGRTIASCAEDVRVIAGALGLDRLAVWGVSGGGPHALACAALLEDLVPAVAAIASPAPWEAEGLDYYAGMGELNVEDSKLMHRDPAAARRKFDADRVQMLAADAEGMLDILRSLLSPADLAALSRDLVEHSLLQIREGLAPGADGWWDDGVALETPWGFDLSAIRTPVLLRHGRQDRFVPFGHGEWLAGRIPGVQAELTDDDGHVTQLVRHLDDIHAWLLERL